jgi:hypothetical protein
LIQLLNFISNVKLFLYAGCALVFLAAVRYWWIAQRERKRTIYGLEKEVAGERSLRALTFAVLSIGVACLIYLADTNLPPVPVSPLRSPTPNVALFITPTATVPPPSPTPAAPTPTPLRGGGVVVIPPVVTPRGPAPTSPPPPPLPTAVSVPPACPNPAVRITSPGVDAHLAGSISIFGTASIPNFQYYKIEYAAGDPPQSWHVLGDVHKQQVSNGVLYTFNSAILPAGVYYLQLTVVDQTSNFPPPCAVRVVLGS